MKIGQIPRLAIASKRFGNVFYCNNFVARIGGIPSPEAFPKQPVRGGIYGAFQMIIIPIAKHRVKPRKAFKRPNPITFAKWIPVSQNFWTLVDDSDYPYLSQFNWTLKTTKRTNYCYCARLVNGRHKAFYMHRVVMDAPKSLQVDHVDGDGLNNRRSNLRLCSIMENHRNMKIHVSAKSSRFKGVYFDKRFRRWVARIMHLGRQSWLGSFVVEEDAAKAYNRAAIKLWGDFARPNLCVSDS